VSSARAIVDFTGAPPRRRKNGDTPVGYSGRAALRREQCEVTPESQNSGSVNTFPSQSYVTTDDQSVSKSLFQGPCGSHDRAFISV
jgi:hypothetical protein